ncbi:MAG: rRNA maturation RNase YbeY [Flavobacteriales bacterium]|nr:rRNA maturation RNase YbeY [Flavobacteriales bacterium]|tara:strand:+ start:70373 stop:70777 length:405 start_codon:yes stop_codon:yes gene_type:complete
MIDFQYINCKTLPIKDSSKWLDSIILAEGKKLGAIVYVFCTDEYLLKKNIQFLNHNDLTDVITFDYCKNNIINGDILISIERVKENAKTFEVNFLTELNRVMAHGLLHLLGYKDKTKEDVKIMRAKENYYLSIK